MKCPQHIVSDPDCPECQQGKKKYRKKRDAISKQFKAQRQAHQRKVVKMRKTLRQALDLLARHQYRDGICIDCRGVDGHHRDGCRVEAVFYHAREHGLNYDRD